jgi:hypothetical protein
VLAGAQAPYGRAQSFAARTQLGLGQELPNPLLFALWNETLYDDNHVGHRVPAQMNAPVPLEVNQQPFRQSVPAAQALQVAQASAAAQALQVGQAPATAQAPVAAPAASALQYAQVAPAQSFSGPAAAAPSSPSSPSSPSQSAARPSATQSAAPVQGGTPRSAAPSTSSPASSQGTTPKSGGSSAFSQRNTAAPSQLGVRGNLLSGQTNVFSRGETLAPVSSGVRVPMVLGRTVTSSGAGAFSAPSTRRPVVNRVRVAPFSATAVSGGRVNNALQRVDQAAQGMAASAPRTPQLRREERQRQQQRRPATRPRQVNYKRRPGR